MIASLTIQNFRGFRNLRLEGLRPATLIAGTNGVGKTSLLEAILLHLAPHNPTLTVTLNPLRGFEVQPADAEEIWGWLFTDRDTRRTIEIASVDVAGKRLEVRITLAPPILPTFSGSTTGNAIYSSIPGPVLTAPTQKELQIESWDQAGRNGRSRAFLTSEGVKVEWNQVGEFPPGGLLAARGRSTRDDAIRFSKVEEERRTGGLVPALRLLEPRLTGLSVLATAGVPMIHADIGIGKLLPLPYLGEGIGRLLSILLALEAARGGILLVDEVENGFHHSILPNVWSAIRSACDQWKVQIIATTHSFECIRAAHATLSFGDNPMLRLVRLDRRGEQIVPTLYEADTLEVAIEEGLEVR